MAAFAVKHIVKELGSLTSILKTVRKHPYSFTSKESEARLAAQGNNVYVIESDSESSTRIYRLGYRYRAHKCYELAGGLLWNDRFKFKIAAGLSAPFDGIYFEHPITIDDRTFIEWYKGETLGMTEIPEKQIKTLERIIADPANSSHPF